jgi:hypothetical protein
MIISLLNDGHSLTFCQKYDLEEKLKKHDAAKKEVDLLYARIFDGPSQRMFSPRSLSPVS